MCVCVRDARARLRLCAGVDEGWHACLGVRVRFPPRLGRDCRYDNRYYYQSWIPGYGGNTLFEKEDTLYLFYAFVEGALGMRKGATGGLRPLGGFVVC